MRAPAGSAVDAFDPRIREQLQAVPTMPATVIAERVGWTRGMTVFKARVAELRPVYLPPDPASRTTYEAGELAQFDFWFPDIELTVGYGQARTAKRLPVMTTVSGYSRFAGAVLIPSREAEDLYAGWWQLLLTQLQGVPKTLVWDGEGAVGRWRARRPELTGHCQAFRGVLGAAVYICKPADPEAKGMLERFHDYLERSFLPGRVFTSPADFNTQLATFLARANARRMRVLGCAPNDRVAADRAAMLPLSGSSSAFGSSAGGGGGGGGGVQGGGGGTAGHYLGGGGGGGQSLRTARVTLGSGTSYTMLGAGNGVLLITPIWGKTATTTTVTVPVGAVYDGTAKTATAVTTNPSGEVVANPSVTYSPGPGAPVNAGTYTASASYPGDDTYEASSDSNQFTIAQAASMVTVTASTATYEGSPHGGTATVTGAGSLNQSLTVTYSGRNGTAYGPSDTAPTAAGDYTASAAYPGDTNHTASSGNANYSIAKVTSVVTVTAPNATYDGNPHGGTAQVAGAGSLDETLTVTYVGRDGTTYGPSETAPTAAGNYTASAAYPGDANHTASSGSADYTIALAPSEVTVTAPNATYDGNPHGGTAQVTGAGSLDETLTVTYVGRNGTTYGPSETAPTAAGDYTASAAYPGDANHTASSSSADYTIEQAALTITAHDATGQYSDLAPALTFEYDGFVNGEGAGDLTGTTTCSTTVGLDVSGHITGPAGDYPITCTGQSSDSYAVTYVDGTFSVTREDAVVTYTGDTLDTVSTYRSSAVQLAGTITEAVDGSLGDKLGTTSLSFTVHAASDAGYTTPLATCTGAVSVTAPGAGVASCQVTLTEGAYLVIVRLVTNGYYTAPMDVSSVAVVAPGTGRTTGGGWLTEPTLTTRSNFGFTVKYLKNGQIQGNSLYIYRFSVAADSVVNPTGGFLPAGDYNWIVKSNDMKALSVKCTTTTPKICSATYTGKATLTAANRVTGTAYPIGGNYQFQVDVTDKGEPGSSNTLTPDTYAIRVWSSAGTVYRLGSPAAQVPITGGNIQVRP